MSARGVTLLTYADRLGGDLPRLRALLDGPLADFSGVHVLPFYTPFDGDDAGFDPIDHTAVDPRLGTWSDVAAIAADREVVADIIVNHVSSSSEEFLDWCEHGDTSRYAGMFLTLDTVLPGGADEARLTAFYRPRPGLPLTPVQVGGTRRIVWTTFEPTQIDLDLHHPATVAYLDRVVAALVSGGVRVVRLDAVGYAIKTPGSASFMSAETLVYVEALAATLRAAGLRVLVEVHAHHSLQQAIAPLVDLVYDFALPPLLLHGLGTGDIEPLLSWLEVRPDNAITVLDTHDGIGVIDAGPAGDLPGLIDHEQMRGIVERAAQATGGHSAIASVVPQWADLPHQINATFPNVVGDDAAYLLCRAVQLFLPGEPQVYYVGLLDGRDDVERFRATGVGREVNRHRYDEVELATVLAQAVPQAILGLVRLRRDHPAFGGRFRWSRIGRSSVRLAWADDGGARLDLDVDMVSRSLSLRTTQAGLERHATNAAELAKIA